MDSSADTLAITVVYNPKVIRLKARAICNVIFLQIASTADIHPAYASSMIEVVIWCSVEYRLGMKEGFSVSSLEVTWLSFT